MITLPQALADTLESSFLISFDPMPDEARFPGKEPDFIISQNKNDDPAKSASKCASKSGERSVCILVPGQKFDASGTRHGRGGGWYDRFLANAPKEWLRVGICSDSRFSPDPLLREVWDEPVDWVLISNGASWQYHETLARVKRP